MSVSTLPGFCGDVYQYLRLPTNTAVVDCTALAINLNSILAESAPTITTPSIPASVLADPSATNPVRSTAATIFVCQILLTYFVACPTVPLSMDFPVDTSATPLPPSTLPPSNPTTIQAEVVMPVGTSSTAADASQSTSTPTPDHSDTQLSSTFPEPPPSAPEPPLSPEPNLPPDAPMPDAPSSPPSPPNPSAPDAPGSGPIPDGPLRVEPTPTIGAQDKMRYSGQQDPNPKVRSMYEVLPELSNVVGVHITHVPGTDSYLFMERPSGYHPIRRMFQIAGTLELKSRKWTPVDTPDGLFCAGQSVTSEGKVVIVGGHRQNAGFPSGMLSVRFFDPKVDATRIHLQANMTWKRWYPTPTLLPSGKIMIMGGTQDVGAGSKPNPEYEIFDPENIQVQPLPKFPVEPTYLKSVTQNYYPFNFPLPTGDMFNFCGRTSRVLVPETGVYRQAGDQLVSGPPRPGKALAQFPFTATAIFTALDPKDNYTSVNAVVFGGAPSSANKDILAVAGRKSNTMKISWKPKADGNGYDYSFSKWEEDDMGIPRVMGDATLLPNGDVILLNGAQTGVAGDSASGGDSRAQYPALWAQLYQPDRPNGQRWTTLSASGIPRMYHSVAALTTNGTILVAGCDRCGPKVISDVDFYNPAKVKAEYRSEIFYPPYYFDVNNKPSIMTISGSSNPKDVIELGYGEAGVVTWNATVNGVPLPPVTGMTLVAPSSATHSFNTNQRVVRLVIESNADGKLVFRTPPHPYVAPPQMYMVFLLNGKTYSDRARWIKLVDRTGAGKIVPQ